MQALVLLVLAGLGVWVGKDKDKELRYVEKDLIEPASKGAISKDIPKDLQAY